MKWIVPQGFIVKAKIDVDVQKAKSDESQIGVELSKINASFASFGGNSTLTKYLQIFHMT